MKSQMKRKPRRPLVIDRLEALEPRALMTGTVRGSWAAATHLLDLTLDNGSISTSPSQEFTINAQQLLDGNGKAVFSGEIIGPVDASFHNVDTELRFRNNQTGPQTIVSAGMFTDEVASSIPRRVKIGFSNATLQLNENAVNFVNVRAFRSGFTTANPFMNFPGGELRVFVDTIAPTVQMVGPIDSPRDTAVPPVAVTTSEALQLSGFTFEDLTLTRNGLVVPLNGNVTVIDAGLPGRYTILGLGGFTDEAGEYQLTVNEGGLFDAAGNPGSAVGSRSTTFTFDPNLNVLPAPPAPDLQAASDSGFSQTDNITSATRVTFDVSAMDPATTVQLLRGDEVVGSRVGSGPIVDPSAPEGFNVYIARQVSDMGIPGRPSVALTVVVDTTAPIPTVALDRSQVTFSGDPDPFTATTARRPNLMVSATDAPDNAANVLFAEIQTIDGQPPSVATVAPAILRGGAFAPLTVPSDLAPGLHTVVIRVRDAASNATLKALTFTVLANPALATPGTPVFSTIYDLGIVQDELDHEDGDDDHDHGDENPWSMSFDRTTQTVWAVVRGDDKTLTGTEGNRLIQLDPATGRVKAWSFQEFDPNSGPHGVFFDFETHLTPRVWFTQRTGKEHGGGRLSYLDLVSGDIVTYDLLAVLNNANFKVVDAQGNKTDPLGDIHAIVVDRRGVVWVSDERDAVLFELDFRGGESGLSSTQGTVVIHTLPGPAPGADNPDRSSENDAGGPHGLEVVVDDRTNQPYVYFAEVLQGRFNMLMPGAAGTQDRWFSWDVDDLLRQELGPNAPLVGQPLFPTIDTNETPNRPEDDRIFFGDTGFRNRTVNGVATVANNVIRELLPGNLVLDANATSSPIQTWHIPADAEGQQAQINQTFVDRDGTVFFIDRQGSVGRLDVNATPGAVTPTKITTTFDARIIREFSTASTAYSLMPTWGNAVVGEAILPLATESATAPGDLMSAPGLDKYLMKTTDPTAAARGVGPFRGALSAGSILFNSLTQGDQIGSTIFAEEARRETAIVVAPNGARKVFQTLRDGSIVLTERDAGGLIDRQRVLTRPGIDPTISGDVTAVIDAGGAVYVFGRDESGGLAEYRLDPVTGVWTSRIVGRAATHLGSDPAAYIDPIRGAVALATTTDGHLVAFFADNGQVLDLTALVGAGDAGLVYSKVGAVVSNGLLFAYGTNQRGDILEYVVPAGAATAAVRRLPLPVGNRELMVFQDLEAVEVKGVRHVFGSDGASRLVHVTIQPDGTTKAENVTELTKALATGYSAYQQPFAARVYGGANPVVAPDGQIFVFGTNGRDLVQFQMTAGGAWSAANLTNRPANRVFGNPSAYISPNGDRHVLLINEDGELIEYYQLTGLEFATTNLTLAQGNSTTDRPTTFPNTLPGTPVAPGAVPSDDHTNFPGFAASPLTLDSGGSVAAAGRIEVAGDRDVFRFVATRTGRLVVDLKGAGLDTVLVALTASKRRIARNDNLSRGSTDSRVAFHVVAGRTYFLQISGKVRRTGAYTLSARYAAGVKIQSRRVQVAMADATSPIVTRFGRPWTKVRVGRA